MSRVGRGGDRRARTPLDRRLLLAAGVLLFTALAFSGLSPLSDASGQGSGSVPCADSVTGSYVTSDGTHHHHGDGQVPSSAAAGCDAQFQAQAAGGQPAVGGSVQPPEQLQILGNTCSQTRLEAHDGFQNGNRCSGTAFGEVPAEDRAPSLLITAVPAEVGVGQPFEITVSTRNLVRNRFLAAADGGYYRESSFLNEEGLVQGHFHTACRMLNGTQAAQDPAPVPAFFVATEDNRGGSDPDSVVVPVTGLPQQGIAQCAVWAGDGSHRVPMMQRANQIPAFDVVRVTVR